MTHPADSLTAAELCADLTRLAAAHDFRFRLEFVSGTYGVWTRGGLGDEADLIGSGDTEAEALADAIATVRGYEQSARGAA